MGSGRDGRQTFQPDEEEPTQPALGLEAGLSALCIQRRSSGSQSWALQGRSEPSQTQPVVATQATGEWAPTPGTPQQDVRLSQSQLLPATQAMSMRTPSPGTQRTPVGVGPAGSEAPATPLIGAKLQRGEASPTGGTPRWPLQGSPLALQGLQAVAAAFHPPPCPQAYAAGTIGATCNGEVARPSLGLCYRLQIMVVYSGPIEAMVRVEWHEV